MGQRMGTAIAANGDAGAAATRAVAQLGGRPIGLVVLFASSDLDLPEALAAVRSVVGEAPVIGCSSAGEFCDNEVAAKGVSIAVLAGDGLSVRTGIGRDFAGDVGLAAEQATQGFAARHHEEMEPCWQGRTLFLFIDGLAGRAEDVIDELISQCGPHYQLFGSAAADQLAFRKTHVFHGDEVCTGAFVVAEVLSDRPFHISMGHGWKPVGDPMRVTWSEGAVLHELNGRPAFEVYQEHAAKDGVALTIEDASVFLMRNILGIDDPFLTKLRVPLFVVGAGSLHCAAEVPSGSVVRFMQMDEDAVMGSGSSAVTNAQQLAGGVRFSGALVAECVATRALLGSRFALEVAATSRSMAPARTVGCAGFGQLAKLDDRFSGLMDATSLVCLIPD